LPVSPRAPWPSLCAPHWLAQAIGPSLCLGLSARLTIGTSCLTVCTPFSFYLFLSLKYFVCSFYACLFSRMSFYIICHAYIYIRIRLLCLFI
jgi:hypothetical protein